MTVLADILQVTHNHVIAGQNLLNVYHVERSSAGESAQDVADAFVNSVVPIIRLWQTAQVINTDVVVFNLDDPTDFHTQSLSGILGLRAGAASPSFVAGGVRFPSTNRAVRSGHKRFAGAQETDYTNGIFGAVPIGLLEDVGDAIIANWLASSDSHVVAGYIVLKRICDETDPVTGKCLKYRLPETTAELLFYEPVTRLINVDATSQVSRKQF